jgi:hypothetical protein
VISAHGFPFLILDLSKTLEAGFHRNWRSMVSDIEFWMITNLQSQSQFRSLHHPVLLRSKTVWAS